MYKHGPLSYWFMRKAFPFKSCSLSFSMIICFRVFCWTLASLPSLRLLLRDVVLPVETIHITSLKWRPSRRQEPNPSSHVWIMFFTSFRSGRRVQRSVGDVWASAGALAPLVRLRRRVVYLDTPWIYGGPEVYRSHSLSGAPPLIDQGGGRFRQLLTLLLISSFVLGLALMGSFFLFFGVVLVPEAVALEAGAEGDELTAWWCITVHHILSCSSPSGWICGRTGPVAAPGRSGRSPPSSPHRWCSEGGKVYPFLPCCCWTGRNQTGRSTWWRWWPERKDNNVSEKFQE